MVDTDLDVPATIDRFVIDVTSPSGTTQSATAMLGDGEPVPPRTLGLVPENDVLGPYEVVARGLLGDVEVVARQARFDFVPKATVVLTMHLVQSCVGRDCGGQTCSENGCEAVLRTDFGAWTGTPPRLGEQPPPFDARSTPEVVRTRRVRGHGRGRHGRGRVCRRGLQRGRRRLRRPGRRTSRRATRSATVSTTTATRTSTRASTSRAT
ncbi:MAG: hypothetical protein R3B99_25655 [Polyangiales bacterium]